MIYPRSNERGQALVAVMMIAALVGVIAASVMNLSTNLNRETRFTDAKTGQKILRDDIAAALQSEKTCMAILKNPPLTGSISLNWPVPNYKDNTVKTIELKKGAQLPHYRLLVNNLAFKNTKNMGSLGGTRTLHLTDVELDAQALTRTVAAMDANGQVGEDIALSERAGKGTIQFKPVVVTQLYLEADKGKVTNCFGPSDFGATAKETCTAAGALFVTNKAFPQGRCMLSPKLVNVMCPDGQYMESFTIAGAKVCKNLPKPKEPEPPKPDPKKYWTDIGTSGLGTVTCPMGVAPQVMNLPQVECSTANEVCSRAEGCTPLTAPNALTGCIIIRYFKCQ